MGFVGCSAVAKNNCNLGVLNVAGFVQERGSRSGHVFLLETRVLDPAEVAFRKGIQMGPAFVNLPDRVGRIQQNAVSAIADEMHHRAFTGGAPGGFDFSVAPDSVRGCGVGHDSFPFCRTPQTPRTFARSPAGGGSVQFFFRHSGNLGQGTQST